MGREGIQECRQSKNEGPRHSDYNRAWEWNDLRHIREAEAIIAVEKTESIDSIHVDRRLECACE